MGNVIYLIFKKMEANCSLIETKHLNIIWCSGSSQVEYFVKFLEVLGRSCKILEDLVQELEISCRFLQVLDNYTCKDLE
jgi:hypothetical protein